MQFRNHGGTARVTGINIGLNSGVVINTGLMTIDITGGGNTLLTSYTQDEADGYRTTIVRAGSGLQVNNLTVTTGALYGTGTYNGSSTTLGTGSSGALVSAGDGADEVGSLIFQGNASTLAGSTWEFDLEGLAQGTEYDHITAWDNLDLAGILLDVSLLNEFMADETDTFTIISANNVHGMFANVVGSTLTLTDGSSFDVTVGSNQVVLSNYQAVPEPAGALLAAAGLAVAVAARRGRR